MRGQQQVRKHDPDMTLISEEEIHEIQRMWRTEQGDWQDTAYAIYKDVTGVQLAADADDSAAFGAMEQKALESACRDNGIPYKLVSTLLNAELDVLGTTARHAKIFSKIDAELKKEWREDIDTIRKELFEQRREEEGAKPNAFG